MTPEEVSKALAALSGAVIIVENRVLDGERAQAALVLRVQKLEQTPATNGTPPGYAIRVDRLERQHTNCPYLTGQSSARVWDMLKIILAAALAAGLTRVVHW